MKQEWLEGHKARKRFGQNFLHDRHWIERIVRGIDPKPGDALIEIGPGQAALTRAVIASAGHEAAVEIDRDLAQFLREQFSPEELTLIEADALKLDWTTVLEGRRLRIIGNLPYNISSPLLFALMSAADRVIDQHFMLQREVVDRMVAEPGSKTYGRLSVMLQYRYVMHKLFDVPAPSCRRPRSRPRSYAWCRAPSSRFPKSIWRSSPKWSRSPSSSAARRCATRSPPSWMTPRSNARASIPPHAPKRSTWRPSCDWHARRPICRITPTPSEPHCPTSSSSGSTFAALSLASCTRQSGQSLSTSFQKTFE